MCMHMCMWAMPNPKEFGRWVGGHIFSCVSAALRAVSETALSKKTEH